MMRSCRSLCILAVHHKIFLQVRDFVLPM